MARSPSLLNIAHRAAELVHSILLLVCVFCAEQIVWLAFLQCWQHCNDVIMTEKQLPWSQYEKHCDGTQRDTR